MGIADDHRRIAGQFTVTVEGTAPAAWGNPAPPEGWVARDVVRHLVEWFPAFLREATGIRLPAGPSVDDDPVGAWRTQTDAVQALLDDPATAERTYELPHLGRMALGPAIDMIYTADVFLHRWDLARATGQAETLDPDRRDTAARTWPVAPSTATKAAGVDTPCRAASAAACKAGSSVVRTGVGGTPGCENSTSTTA